MLPFGFSMSLGGFGLACTSPSLRTGRAVGPDGVCDFVVCDFVLDFVLVQLLP